MQLHMDIITLLLVQSKHKNIPKRKDNMKNMFKLAYKLTFVKKFWPGSLNPNNPSINEVA